MGGRVAAGCGLAAVLGVALLAAPALPASQPERSAPFDPEAATEAYLASVPPAERARSDAYFEGGYWLQLWGFLYGSAVNLLLLASGLSARMRDRAARLARARPVQTGLYWAQFLLVTTVGLFPLTVYQGFVREHQYGLATQTFAAWLWDQGKALMVSLLVGGLFVIALYGVLRRAPRSWWLWGSAVSVAFTIIGLIIAPVFIAPLFNTYTPLDDPTVREPILRLARANGIDARVVYQVDASRQTTRISANVSGLFGTERISLNDNLLKRCTLPEIEAVMGHEIGHYVLNHIYELVVSMSLLLVAGFRFLQWGVTSALARWGARWQVSGVDDPAGFPLLAFLFGAYFFVLTPVVNTIGRTIEFEADLFGLNAARQPDGFAQVALKLGEYRKLDPSRLEEWIFYDHPSGRTRILTAMRWKAAHLTAPAPEPAAGVRRPQPRPISVFPILLARFPFCRYSVVSAGGPGGLAFRQTFE